MNESRTVLWAVKNGLSVTNPYVGGLYAWLLISGAIVLFFGVALIVGVISWIISGSADILARGAGLMFSLWFVCSIPRWILTIQARRWEKKHRP